MCPQSRIAPRTLGSASASDAAMCARRRDCACRSTATSARRSNAGRLRSPATATPPESRAAPAHAPRHGVLHFGRQRRVTPAPPQKSTNIFAASSRRPAATTHDVLRKPPDVGVADLAADLAERHRFVQRQARDATSHPLRKSQRDQAAIRVADEVDPQMRLDEVIELRGDEADLLVQREGSCRTGGRVVAVAQEIERDHAKPRRQPIGECGPLRLRSERRVQHDDRRSVTDDEMAESFGKRSDCAEFVGLCDGCERLRRRFLR